MKMSECCSTSNSSRKHICPSNGKAYIQVSTRTILHHISQPWLHKLNDTNYYFCTDPNCEVIYFGQDNTVINKSMLRTEVGIKEKSNNALICYCFGVTKKEAEENPGIKDYVIEQTKNHTCSCETSNPSGKCCLKDFK